MSVFTKKIICRNFLITYFSLSFIYGGFLHTSNKLIVDGNGEKVILRGVALGGWLVPEGYMFQIPGSGSPTTIRKKIVDLIGETETEKYYQKFEKNYIQEQDIKAIAGWGFNSIRMPLHYKKLSPTKGEYSEKGFAMIDSVVAWSKKYKLYVILDMHAAPGGQSPGEIADAHGTAELWINRDYQDWLIAIWSEIASRYSKEETIGGYDLINEPVLPNNMSNKQNRNLHIRIRNRIRQYDQNHIIFVNGNWYSTSFDGLGPAFDDNMVWSFHKYWNDVTLGTIQYLINFRNSTNTPLWLGEFGENSNEWWSRVIDLVESKDIGWNWWTYKKYQTITTIASVPITKNYQTILDYWAGKTPKPNQEVSISGLTEMADGLLLVNCDIKKDVIASLIDEDYRKKSKPYKDHKIPGDVALVDYDIGALGISYMDYDYMRTGVGNQKSGGNSGWAYRNDGVDIERSTDTLIVPYNIGWTEEGESMSYTVEVIKEGLYSFHLRSASESSGASIIIFSGQNKIIDGVDLPNTGDTQIWVNTKLGEAILPKGKQIITVRINRPGANLKLLSVQSNEAENGLRIFEHQIHPNPMGELVKVEFSTLVNSDITLSIYDLTGRVIWINRKNIKVGKNELYWFGKNMNGDRVSNGVYLLTLNDGNKLIQEKITLVR